MKLFKMLSFLFAINCTGWVPPANYYPSSGNYPPPPPPIITIPIIKTITIIQTINSPPLLLGATVSMRPENGKTRKEEKLWITHASGAEEQTAKPKRETMNAKNYAVKCIKEELTETTVKS